MPKIIWETIISALEDDEKAPVWLPRDSHDKDGLTEVMVWQANLVLLRIISASDIPEVPKNLRRRLMLAVIKNAAINADSLTYRTEAAHAIALLRGEKLLQNAINNAGEKTLEGRNLRDLQKEINARQ